MSCHRFGDIAAETMRDATVYLHFPWCLEKCPYCDFVSYKAERPAIPQELAGQQVQPRFQAGRSVGRGRWWRQCRCALGR